MPLGKARPRRTMGRKIKEQIVDKDRLWSAKTTNVTGDSAIRLNGPKSSGGNTGIDGQSLHIAGGTMIGAIAFFPKVVKIKSDKIDIGAMSGNYSSRVILAVESGTADDLKFIENANNAGQLLIIQGITTHTTTIKNAADAASGNIETLDGEDFSLVDDDNVMFIFDSIDNKWQQLTSGKQSDAATDGANKTLSNLTTPTALNQSLIPGVTKTLSLGAPLKYYQYGYIHDLYVSNSLSVINDLAVGDDLLVSGDATIVGNTEVRGDIIPNTTNTRDLGAPLKYFLTGYIKNLYVSNSLNVENDLNVTDDISHGGHITPNTTNTSNLGAPLLHYNYGYFKNLYVANDLSVVRNLTVGGELSIGGNTSVLGDIIPTTTKTRDLGTSLKYFHSGFIHNLYVSNSLNVINDLGVGDDLSVSGATTVAGHVLPSVTLTTNLGSSSKRFNDVYVMDLSISDDLYVGDDVSIGGDVGITGTVTVGNDIVPNTTNTRDLGTSSKYFDNAYIQDLYIGNSVSIADDLNVVDNITLSGTISPNTTNSSNLGGATKYFNNAFIQDLYISNSVNIGDDLAVGDDLHVGDDIEIDGDLNHDGSRIGFRGKTPSTAQNWSYTNASGITFNVNRTTPAINASLSSFNFTLLLRAFRTLVGDLEAQGIVG